MLNLQLIGKKDDAMDWYLSQELRYPSGGDVVVSHNQSMAYGIRDAELLDNKLDMAYFATEAITDDSKKIRRRF